MGVDAAVPAVPVRTRQFSGDTLQQRMYSVGASLKWEVSFGARGSAVVGLGVGPAASVPEGVARYLFFLAPRIT